MGGDVFFDAGCTCCVTQDLPESQPRHIAASAGNEKVVASFAFQDEWSAIFEVEFDLFFCLFTKGDKSFFVSFAKNTNKTGR